MKKECEANITGLEKTSKITRYRKEETDLKKFNSYFPSPRTTEKPQTKNPTESSWKAEVYCITENLAAYSSKQKKNVCSCFLMFGNILSRNLWQNKSWHLSQIILVSWWQGAVQHSTFTSLSSSKLKASRPCLLNLASWIRFWYAIQDITSSLESPS